MNTSHKVLIISLLLVFSSCDVLKQVASTEISSATPLSSEQVAQGLKEALEIGAKKAVSQLNKKDGYYLDQLVKINLPPQADEIVKYANKVPGLDKMIEDLVLQINRSAENAAAQAKPIFIDAISSMSIADAWAILKGDDNAATGYLKDKTYEQLLNLYAPIVQKSLGKPLVAGISASKSWKEITGTWNKFSDSLTGKLLGVNKVEESLDEYVTTKALNGLFFKVEDQERIIRKDINARTSDLLKRVFGQQDS